jgi:pimeloyl-ACP methyl ester carboxylesterase
MTASEVVDKEEMADRGSYDFDRSLLNPLPSLPVRVDRIEYRTTDPFGRPVIASGIVSYPLLLPVQGVMVAQHFNTSANRDVPSVIMGGIESLLSYAGYVVISADYLGYGSSAGIIHPYHHVESTGQSTVDMVLAVQEYFAAIGRTPPNDVTVVGYSQGGAAALSFQKVAEERYASQIRIKQVFAGAGAYDLVATYEVLRRNPSAPFPLMIPTLYLGLDYAENLQLDFSEVFTGNLLTHYQEWILSKTLNNGELNDKLGMDIWAFMNEEVFNLENLQTERFIAALEKNSLLDWTPQAPLVLVQSEDDEYLPFANAQNAYDSFKARGCDVRLVRFAGMGHVDTGVSYFMFVLEELGLIEPQGGVE